MTPRDGLAGRQISPWSLGLTMEIRDVSEENPLQSYYHVKSDLRGEVRSGTSWKLSQPVSTCACQPMGNLL